ncbi:hypothetical protein QBC37DRAFT_374750 [Rhypophila decipiens]|uniref:Uncharacterized protein n=1 Tax=Rhypophila decipiens TaxID=261697 RepID=A0AAN6Y4V7_9PEZI|nr:hypothetical protein QBC37DRAFT_374750 [Rhypophila decipiens]
MRANFGFIVASFMLFTSAFAMPVDTDVEVADDNNKDTSAIASRLSPNCSRNLVDMCLTVKAGTGCDNDGNLITKVPACYPPACWCE